jgi:hypothetical protein
MAARMRLNVNLRMLPGAYGLVENVIGIFVLFPRSKGIGFVTMASLDEVDVAMSRRPHEIDDKIVCPRRCKPNEVRNCVDWLENVMLIRLFLFGCFAEYRCVERQH